MTGFVEHECWSCGVRFGITQRLDSCRRQDKGTFYCPNGHGANFTESEADKLRRERDKLKQDNAYQQDRVARERQRREAAERQAAAFKGVATKLKKRAAVGVCPCCNRQFSDLQRHMQSKHAGFVAEAVSPDPVTIQ